MSEDCLTVVLLSEEEKSASSSTLSNLVSHFTHSPWTQAEKEMFKNQLRRLKRNVVDTTFQVNLPKRAGTFHTRNVEKLLMKKYIRNVERNSKLFLSQKVDKLTDGFLSHDEKVSRKRRRMDADAENDENYNLNTNTSQSV